MTTIFIWWYLVSYSPNNTWIKNILQREQGTVIAEFTALDGSGGCEEQRLAFYRESPRGFARCEGSKQKRPITSKEQLEISKLQAEINNLRMEAEIRRRILEDRR